MRIIIQKGDFEQKKRFLMLVLKDFWYTKINPTQIWYDGIKLISIWC